MPLITVNNLTKYYDTDLILDHVSFAIDHRERLGFIGANGTGKSTLCRILMGQEPYEDDSELHIARGATIGYLSQDVDFGEARTPWQVAMSAFAHMHALEAAIKRLEELLAAERGEQELHDLLDEHARLLADFEAAGGHEYERTAASVLTGLGVAAADLHRDLTSFSGGEQRRVALAQLLLRAPDLLLLDEPTNHLDIVGTEWLEGYLQSYPGAVVAISHDRRFLDVVAQRILELDCHVLTEYRGGYTDYVQQKEQRLLTYERQYERQQDELKRQLSFIRWALGTQQEKRVKAAKSRMKLLEKMDYLDPPLSQRRTMNLRFKPRIRGGDEVLELSHVGKRYGERVLFHDVSLFVRRGQRLGIVGPNGSGKTTLLRIALGQEPPSEGQVRLGRSLEVGYHRQDHFGLSPENRVYDEFKLAVPDALEAEVRNLLARFLFVDEDVFKRVGDLSGGEQSRLSLAKLIMTRPSVLVLDEPTNHLDIDSRNALEGALKEYEGTIIVVSHDRYFLDNVVQRVLILHQEVGIVHEGNYGSYVAFRAQREAEVQEAAARVRDAERQTRLEEERRARKARKLRESRDAAAARAPRGPSVEELEERAHYLETQLARIRDVLGRPETYATPRRVDALNAEYARLSEELETVYHAWHEAEQSLTP